MRTTQDYLNLITNEHRQKPVFVATVSVAVSPLVQVQSVLNSLTAKYDVDYAVGEQLDRVGEWVGVTRYLTTPLTGVYFTWDDADSTGWDYGTWRAPFDPISGLTALPDDEYRILVKAKIAANAWDGSIPKAYEIWETVFVDSTILIQDNQDMTMTVGVVGGLLSTITKALLTGGYIPLKPEGVAVDYYAVTPDGGPMFAWDADSAVLKGWDQGSWAQVLPPT